MKRDIAKDKHFVGMISDNTYFDFASPYGYGGWLIEGRKDTTGLFDEYTAWCQRNGIVSEFVRFHPLLKNHLDVISDYEVVPLGEVVHMDLASPETIWANITSKNRNVIRKAIKNDVKIFNGRYPELFETFRNIYNGTMDKDHADAYYYFDSDFYSSVENDLADNAQVFYAQIPDGTIIAASIILAANERMFYHLSGSVREYSSLAATNLLLYEAALWGCTNGYKIFYLGGGVGSGEDSLFKFKRAFYRGDLNRFYIGKKIYMQDKYDALMHIRVENNNEIKQSSFFPQYRG